MLDGHTIFKKQSTNNYIYDTPYMYNISDFRLLKTFLRIFDIT